MNIHVGLGDIIFTRIIIQNLRLNNYNERINLYISKNLINTYRDTFYGLSQEECHNKILDMANYLLNDLDTWVFFGEYEDFDYNKFLSYYSNILTTPLKCLQLKKNYNIELPEKFITINAKCYGLKYENWLLCKDNFINYINQLNIPVILLGDKVYVDNAEYNQIKTQQKNVYVIHNDLLKIDNIIDLTFTNTGEIIDTNILERNIHIINKSHLNLVFSTYGTLIFTGICGKTITYTDNTGKWYHDSYEQPDITYCYDYDTFIKNINKNI